MTLTYCGTDTMPFQVTRKLGTRSGDLLVGWWIRGGLRQVEVGELKDILRILRIHKLHKNNIE